MVREAAAKVMHHLTGRTATERFAALKVLAKLVPLSRFVRELLDRQAQVRSSIRSSLIAV